VDASLDPFDLNIARMVNDAATSALGQNCKMKIVSHPGSTPNLCLFATRDIAKGTELRYDYGVNNLPWRKKVYIHVFSLLK
jgi:SET domain-containing protein